MPRRAPAIRALPANTHSVGCASGDRVVRIRDAEGRAPWLEGKRPPVFIHSGEPACEASLFQSTIDESSARTTRAIDRLSAIVEQIQKQERVGSQATGQDAAERGANREAEAHALALSAKLNFGAELNFDGLRQLPSHTVRSARPFEDEDESPPSATAAAAPPPAPALSGVKV
jgi:hypothetical protein